MSAKWDERFLKLAEHISGWSKAPSTKVGCVVVGEDREIRSTGFNGFPRGIADDIARLEDREQKYPLICHAEENAIVQAAINVVKIKSAELYVTSSPCYNCFKLIANAGINSIYFDEFYRDEQIITRSKEAGIQLIDINN